MIDDRELQGIWVIAARMSFS